MICVRRVDHVQKHRILTYSFDENKNEINPKNKRKRNRPVSVVLNKGNQLDFNMAQKVPSNPFLSSFATDANYHTDSNNGDDKGDGNKPKQKSPINWSSYPDDAISPLISYFASLDVNCLVSSITGSTMLLTLKAAHDLSSFETQIILTKAIYAVLKSQSFDEVILPTLIYSRVHQLCYLLLLLDCDICDNFAVINFRPCLDRLTIDDLCAWLQTSSHLKISSVDYLSSNDSSHSIYECDEGMIFDLITSWLRYDVKGRICHLPVLLKLTRWNALARPFDGLMAIEEVRSCQWARRFLKRTFLQRSAIGMSNCERPRHSRFTLTFLGPDLYQPEYLRNVLSRLDEDGQGRSSFLCKNQALLHRFFDKIDTKRPSCMYVGLPVDVRIPACTRSVIFENCVIFMTSLARNSQMIVYKCDVTTGVISYLPSPKCYRADNFSLTIVDCNLIVLGGIDGSKNVVLDIERLHLRKPKPRWTKLSRIPRMEMWQKQSCCNYQGKLFCWLICSSGLNVTYLFRFETEEWTPAISTWYDKEMIEIESDIESLSHGNYVVSVSDRFLYTFDLHHNDMISVRLPRVSERNVVFDGGFYRYNIENTGAIDTLLLIHPGRFDMLRNYLTDRDTCVTLFENNLCYLDLPESVSIPYRPDTCLVSALKLDVNREMFCKVDSLSPPNTRRNIVETIRQLILCL